MNKKGFTLVELLAVIVILALIALIATPIILNVINDAKKQAAKDSAYGYMDAVEKYIVSSELEDKSIKAGRLIKSVIGTYTQIPLKLAYAITIHKSQGQTFNKINLNPYCFCEGQLYVALSRASTSKGLYIKQRYINSKWLMTSSKVIDFYDSIE